MVSHASSPLNSLRFPSAAKSKATWVILVERDDKKLSKGPLIDGHCEGLVDIIFEKRSPSIVDRFILMLLKHQVNTARASSTNNVNTVRASSTKDVSTARHNFNSQAVPTNAARKVNTVKPIDYPQRVLKNKGIVDSGCSRHMTGNKAYLAEYQDYNGGPVAFRGSKGYISGKGKIKTGKLDFEDMCFVKELQHFNLFYVSQMCDKKNKVLFTDTECLVLSPDFKLLDEN
ncbi:hypothetical protein Tco_1532276 [Tanacetum coccineum]